MKKILCAFWGCLFACLGVFAETTSSSLPPNTYVPQATPQSMYGLSGQQFVPQINITGSSSGVQIDTPYFDKTKEEGQPNEDAAQQPVRPINSKTQEEDLTQPIYLE